VSNYDGVIVSEPTVGPRVDRRC